MGRSEVTRFVEESDCILLLGAFMTDINLGIFTANLDPARCIYVTSETMRIRHHHYHDVLLSDFLSALIERNPVAPVRPLPAALTRPPEPYVLSADSPVTISRMIARLNEQIDEDTIVIADIGDALFGATELTIHGRTEFISPAYYTSMGFSVPAALGAQIAQPQRRVVVLVGDGAFQMTGMELSTIVRHGFDPIVIVQDNGGYGTERFLHAGEWAYNDIQPWRYHRLPELLGGGRGYEVRTEGDFDRALSEAWSDRTQPSLIQVHLDRKDASNALHRLADRLSKKI
jgi:indolepyruvate decarboxylase